MATTIGVLVAGWARGSDGTSEYAREAEGHRAAGGLSAPAYAAEHGVYARHKRFHRARYSG